MYIVRVSIIPLCMFQVLSNGLLLLCGNLVGYFYVHSTASGHQQTVERTKSCVESRQVSPIDSKQTHTHNIMYN